MGVTRKERLLKAMLEDNAAACGGGVTREERLIASAAKKVCDNDALEGGGAASWNDLTDVPFGEKEEWVGLIPETSVTFSTGGYGEYKENFSSYGALAAGNYKVIFDGKEYYVSPMYQGINMMPAGEMSEEMPFQFQSSFGKLYVFAPGKHTIAVYKKKTVVTPIPEKYIPLGVSGVRLWKNPAETTGIDANRGFSVSVDISQYNLIQVLFRRSRTDASLYSGWMRTTDDLITCPLVYTAEAAGSGAYLVCIGRALGGYEEGAFTFYGADYRQFNMSSQSWENIVTGNEMIPIEIIGYKIKSA